jgi:indolepyruvate ferredoxin oxidoreductase alpha subunit
VLKLGMTHPLPKQAIRRFAERYPRLMVIEELEPYLDEQVRALGITPLATNLPRTGELTVPLVRNAVAAHAEVPPTESQAQATSKPLRTRRRGDFATERSRPEAARPVPRAPELPVRPPALCAGCSHRGTFHALGRLDAIVTFKSLSPAVMRRSSASSSCSSKHSSRSGGLPSPWSPTRGRGSPRRVSIRCSARGRWRG